MKTDRKRLTLLLLLLVYAITLAVTGCGRVTPMGPDVDVDSKPGAMHATTSAMKPIVVSDDPRSGGPMPEVGSTPPVDPTPGPGGDPVEQLGGGLSNTPVGFVQTLAHLVKPNSEMLLLSGRWVLDFHPGSLSAKKVIRIYQAVDGSLRAKFGPDGTQFGTPVDLTVSYAGTSFDPASPKYVRGFGPVLMWLDPATGKWVEVPSTYDASTKTVHAQLHHFSTYGIGGRAGW